MKHAAIPLLLSCALLAACGRGEDTRVLHLPADGPVAEIVNGTPVPQSLLEAVAHSRGLHLDHPDQREQALKTVTDMVLIAQLATRDGLDRDPQYRAEVEAARLKGVAEASVAAYEKRVTLSDQMLHAQYDSEVAAAGKYEYDFTQLLFADEATALKAEDALAGGKPFAQVFDDFRGQAKQAKAFSHIRVAQMPEVLAKQLDTLKDGEHTTLPVKTEFGWHVLQRDAASAFTPPPFEQVKENLRRTMLLKASTQQLEKARETAKVEYPTTAPPAPAAAPAAASPPGAEKKG